MCRCCVSMNAISQKNANAFLLQVFCVLFINNKRVNVAFPWLEMLKHANLLQCFSMHKVLISSLRGLCIRCDALLLLLWQDVAENTCGAFWGVLCVFWHVWLDSAHRHDKIFA